MCLSSLFTSRLKTIRFSITITVPTFGMVAGHDRQLLMKSKNGCGRIRVRNSSAEWRTSRLAKRKISKEWLNNSLINQAELDKELKELESLAHAVPRCDRSHARGV